MLALSFVCSIPLSVVLSFCLSHSLSLSISLSLPLPLSFPRAVSSVGLGFSPLALSVSLSVSLSVCLSLSNYLFPYLSFAFSSYGVAGIRRRPRNNESVPRTHGTSVYRGLSERGSFERYRLSSQQHPPHKELLQFSIANVCEGVLGYTCIRSRWACTVTQANSSRDCHKVCKEVTQVMMTPETNKYVAEHTSRITGKLLKMFYSHATCAASNLTWRTLSDLRIQCAQSWALIRQGCQ